MGLAEQIKICKILTDLHPEGVAGECCVFNSRSTVSLSPSLAPDGKQMLGGLFLRVGHGAQDTHCIQWSLTTWGPLGILLYWMRV